jgi:hypothetical protein
MADEPTFENVEAIRKFYGKQIKDAEDADKPALQLAQSEAIATFNEARAVAADRKLWLKDALDEFPAAKDFLELVTGDTEEAIKASAKATAERVAKLTANNPNPEAERLYGDPVRPGGGTPPPPRQTDDEKFVKDFETRYNDPAGQYSKAEAERYAKVLASTSVIKSLAENSQHFKRAGITPEKVDRELGLKAS